MDDNNGVAKKGTESTKVSPISVYAYLRNRAWTHVNTPHIRNQTRENIRVLREYVRWSPSFASMCRLLNVRTIDVTSQVTRDTCECAIYNECD